MNDELFDAILTFGGNILCGIGGIALGLWIMKVPLRPKAPEAIVVDAPTGCSADDPRNWCRDTYVVERLRRFVNAPKSHGSGVSEETIGGYEWALRDVRSIVGELEHV